MTGNLLSAIAMSMMVGIGAIGVYNAPDYNPSYYTCVVDEDTFGMRVNAYGDGFLMTPFDSAGKKYGYARSSGIEYYTTSQSFTGVIASVNFTQPTYNIPTTSTRFTAHFHLNHIIANNYLKESYVYFDTLQFVFTGMPSTIDIENSDVFINDNQGLSDIDITRIVFNEGTMILTGFTFNSDYAQFNPTGYTTLDFDVSFRFSGNHANDDWTNFDLECFIFADYQKAKQDNAYSLGYNTCYSEGYRNGVGDGYNSGYSTALNELSENHTFMALFNSVADTPLRFLYGLFNFDIFGTSVLVIVLSGF